VNLAAAWSTGLPFTVLNATDISNTNPGASAADRPNQLGSARLAPPTPAKYFNVDAFAPQAPRTLGSERSNQLYGPPSRHFDASLFRNIALAGGENFPVSRRGLQCDQYLKLRFSGRDSGRRKFSAG